MEAIWTNAEIKKKAKLITHQQDKNSIKERFSIDCQGNQGINQFGFGFGRTTV